MTLTLTMIILIRIRLMGQPGQTHRWLRETPPCSASACPFRSEWLMAFVARRCCCCLVRVQAYTHTFLPAFSMLFCIFLFTVHHHRCVINLLIYSTYLYLYICMYTICCIYNFFHSCLSFCVMRFSLLRFGPHVPCVSVCVCPVRVIKKQPPLRHIKALPGIKISHQPRLAAIPIPIPIPPSSHPSIQLSTLSSVYPASQLSISSLAFRINAWIIFCIIPIIVSISYISFQHPKAHSHQIPYE